MANNPIDMSVAVESKEAIKTLASELDYFRCASVDVDEELYEFEICVDNVAIALAQLDLVRLDEDREASLGRVVSALADAKIVDPELVEAVHDLQTAMARISYDLTDIKVKKERDRLAELLAHFVGRLREET